MDQLFALQQLNGHQSGQQNGSSNLQSKQMHTPYSVAMNGTAPKVILQKRKSIDHSTVLDTDLLLSLSAAASHQQQQQQQQRKRPHILSHPTTNSSEQLGKLELQQSVQGVPELNRNDQSQRVERIIDDTTTDSNSAPNSPLVLLGPDQPTTESIRV